MADKEIEKKQAELDQIIRGLEADRERRILREPSVRAAVEERRLCLERELGAAAGTEYAEEMPLDHTIGDEWHLVANTDPLLISGDVGQDFLTLFNFKHTEEFRLSGLHDEAGDHPLVGRGLGLYGLFVVRNSEWRTQVLSAALNSMPSYDHVWWSRLEHFIVRGKGGELECLARSVAHKMVRGQILEIRTRIGCFWDLWG